MTSNYQEYLEKEIFLEQLDYYQKLQLLHKKKMALKEKIRTFSSPFIVEFSGSPRSGKTTSVNLIYDFFKNADFKVKYMEEPAAQIKKIYATQSESQKLTAVEFNNQALCISEKFVEEISSSDLDLVLLDRGVLDNYIWFEKMHREGLIGDKDYILLMNQRMSWVKDKINLLYLMFCQPDIAVKRDYLNSLYLEERKKTNHQNIMQLNDCMSYLIPYFEKALGGNSYVRKLDTSFSNIQDNAIELTSTIISSMEKR